MLIRPTSQHCIFKHRRRQESSMTPLIHYHHNVSVFSFVFFFRYQDAMFSGLSSIRVRNESLPNLQWWQNKARLKIDVMTYNIIS